MRNKIDEVLGSKDTIDQYAIAELSHSIAGFSDPESLNYD